MCLNLDGYLNNTKVFNHIHDDFLKLHFIGNAIFINIFSNNLPTTVCKKMYIMYILAPSSGLNFSCTF